jgi:hypothetical protein
MTLATRPLLPMLVLAAAAAVLVGWRGLSGQRWEDCADPYALLDAGEVPGTRSAERIPPPPSGHAFALVRGELDAAPGGFPLVFRLVRSDHAAFLFDGWAGWLGLEWDPDRMTQHEVEVDGERVLVRVASRDTRQTEQVFAYLFVYAGSPVDGLLVRQLRTAPAQVVRGTLPITFYAAGGTVPDGAEADAEAAGVQWVIEAWRRHRDVCGR